MYLVRKLWKPSDKLTQVLRQTRLSSNIVHESDARIYIRLVPYRWSPNFLGESSHEYRWEVMKNLYISPNLGFNHGLVHIKRPRLPNDESSGETRFNHKKNKLVWSPCPANTHR